MSSRPITLRAAAAELELNESTLRRWVAEGAPCIQPGEPGRGRGALVDLEAIRAWRAQRSGLTVCSSEPSGLHCAIARGLLAAYKRGNAGESEPLWRPLRIRSGSAALLLAETYIAIVRELTGHEPTGAEPDEVRALRRLAADQWRIV